MASFPDSIFSPASKNNGDTIQASHVTDLDGEVVAIEQGLRNGTAPLNSSNSTFAALSVTGGSTFATVSAGASTLASANVSGASTLAGAVTFRSPFYVPTASTTLSGGSTRFDNVALPSTGVLLRVDGNSTAIAISGLSTATDGRVLYLANVESAAAITLLDEDANSSATSRFQLGGSNRTINAGGLATLVYDGVTGRWRG